MSNVKLVFAISTLLTSADFPSRSGFGRFKTFAIILRLPSFAFSLVKIFFWEINVNATPKGNLLSVADAPRWAQ